MALYSPTILKHYKKPLNVGKLPNYSKKAEELNTSCGDRTVVFIRLEGNKIAEISHETEGCAVAVASASILSKELKGMLKKQVENLGAKDVQEFLGTKLTESRIKCALLPLLAIQKMFKD